MEHLSAEEWQIVTLSLKVAFWATVFSLPFGIAVAYALAKKSFRGKQLLNILVHLPLIMPPVVTGYLLLIVFGRSGAIGSLLHDAFGVTLAFRWTGAVLAGAIMAFPLMVRAIRLGFEAVDEGLIDAAKTLSVSRLQIFLKVSLPLALPGIIAGVVLAFAKALGEFGATITFVSNIPGQTQTLPTAIYSFLQVPGGEAGAFRLIALSIFLAVAALVVSEVIAQRSATRMGRR